ncbi:hypothetical protein RU97_GL000202 [Enterococcus canis]|uniref:Penicillin-binding protein 4 n=1 Tax=Enterococcus canis TaxID=214095 RepID=A0A1L8RJM9_9ENTE|nr:penicillin-binding transpeptidase domain-containing protein [Enterococcus canis]OJG19969.1 hypothetical protein RU97_GL000202 [Enterococcus canis]
MRSQKKKKWPLILISSILVIAAAGGWFGWQYYSQQKALAAAETTVKKFTEVFTKNKTDQLTTLLDADALKRNGFTEDEVQQKYAAILTGIGASDMQVSDLTVTSKEDGFEFSFKLAFSTGLGRLADLQYDGLVKNEKIEWYPGLILPGMTGKDKISYTASEPVRGEILDRNGTGLAINQDFYQIGVVPKDLGDGADKAANLKAISNAYGIEVKTIEKALAQDWVQPDYFVPLKIVEKEPKEMTGLATQTVKGRYYPLKDAGAQLVGYLGKVTAEDIEKNPALSADSEIGRSGLEMAYDKRLRGQAGGRLAITDENGTVKQVLQEVEEADGETIRLTIDAKAQKIAFDSLAGAPGSTVAHDPQTGELLVAASSPSFDPNKMTQGISQKDYDAYNNDPLLPFTSRFATRYVPGSTFKIITAGIGLDAGTIDPSQKIAISGLKWQKDASWGDYWATRVQDVPEVNLLDALIYSDNIYFAQETLKMGEDTFRKGLNNFIFGEELDLPIAMTPAQISNEDTFGSEILLADTGYGQGELLISPIQQLTMYSFVPNHGTLVYPVIEKSEQPKTKAVIKADSAKQVDQDLQTGVTDPTGLVHPLASLGVSLGAKTGTAEIKEKQDTTGQENSFLYAYDAASQKYAILTFIEDSRNHMTAISIAPELLQYLAENY